MVQMGKSTLLVEHADADHHATALLAAARSGDKESLRARWLDFEGQLVLHMSHEEIEVLPAYAKEEPTDAGEIVDQHTDVRIELKAVRNKVTSGVASTDDILHAINAFRIHHAHEETTLYRWLAARPKG